MNCLIFYINIRFEQMNEGKSIYILLNRALSGQLYYIDYVRNRTQSKLKINIVEHMINTSIDLQRILRINFKRLLLF